MRTGRPALLLVAAVFALFNPGVAVGQLSSEFLKQMWTAQWITCSDSPQRDPVVLHFRKLMELAQAPQHFLVHVSADNQFIYRVERNQLPGGSHAR